MAKLFTWDGRAPFYPDVGYEKDKEFVNRFREYLISEGISLENGDSEDDDSGDESDEGAEVTDGLSEQLVQSPPLYDRSDHYHPMSRTDTRISMLGKCMQSRNGESMRNMLPRRMRSEKTASEVIAEEVQSMINHNRKGNYTVKQTLRSNIVLEARIAGLSDGAPTREMIVPGNLILSALHDR
mmetsp:Transcript_30235/g.54750  ORF Transcript_30235/g.54750 Transcript_30235/m.54750 type:complete len:183 (+) Transcript_30235:112-660(+)|eukprot:CAMPEP_0201913882 /NCGR_PEP_ID=MMETSP0903-20130614/4214_1 /ASSEMBLY_ACC=CAM_ASM_000552 /TAXON_ID=420261 /ORGANISM="Thalassiosira antarctica, Strain CCMP982" /LENGTH=182 /DNA_ID=CAMNT_0048449163 /DNA_START=76 /DNA_END=624 /DNA_ORIENTATION=+